MHSLTTLTGLTLACSATGFVGVPKITQVSGAYSIHTTYSDLKGRGRVFLSVHGRKRAQGAWVTRSCGVGLVPALCMTAETGEQGKQREALPRLKRVRRRRKDASYNTTIEGEEDGVSDEMPSSPDASPDADDSSASTTFTEGNMSAETPSASGEGTSFTAETGEASSSSIRAGTKGTKVRVGVDDSSDDMAERLTGAASAATQAAGVAASAVSGAASSAVGAALTTLGGKQSSVYAPEEPQEEKAPKKRKGPDMSELGEDIARFREMEGRSRRKGESDDGGFALGARDLISTIITLDFFVVIAFMLWFIAGVISSYGLKNSFLLDEFNASWNPIVQPALGILMGGTIAGGVVSKLRNSGDDDSRRR